MFSILIRDTARSLRNSIFKVNLPSSIIGFDYSSFTTRDFVSDNDESGGTLLVRFMKYLAMENSRCEPLIPTKIRYPDFFPVTDSRSFQSELRKIDVTQIPHLIIFAFTYKSNGDPLKFVGVINEIDKYCENHLNEMDLDTVFRTLYAFMFLIPPKVTKTNFFNKALDRLVATFDKECPKEKFVKVCFYLGMGKKNPNSINLLNKFLRSHLQRYLPELTSLDLAIVGNAAFKASIPMESQEFMDKIKSEIMNIDSEVDDSLLVNMLKILRYNNKLQSQDVCEKLDAICSEKQLQSFPVITLSHLFAYFAEAQWNDKKTGSKFINATMSKIRSSSEYVRAKDLATFLWCCSQLQLGDLFKPNDLKHIDHMILQKIERDEYKYFSDQLIGSALSLWSMGHQSRGIIAEVTSLRINPNVSNPDRSKLDTRYKVLISCVAVEQPDWLMRGKKQVFVESLAAPEYLYKNKVGLKKALSKLHEEQVDAEIVSPIEGINVAGILVKLEENKISYLEVLEDNQVLRFDKVPVAIVQLKVRLLKHLGYNVVMVRASELDNITSIKDLFSSGEEPMIKEKNAATKKRVQI